MGSDPLSRIASLMERLGDRLDVTLREKDLEARTLFGWAHTLLPISKKSGSRLTINGRIDVVKCFAPAIGLHLPEDGIPLGEAQRILPPGTVIGVSVHSKSSAISRAREGATLLLLSPVFPTPSKPATWTGQEPGLGLAAVEQAVREIDGRAEVFALGGIDASNAARVLDTGVDGIAAVRGVWCADRPEDLLAES